MYLIGQTKKVTENRVEDGTWLRCIEEWAQAVPSFCGTVPGRRFGGHPAQLRTAGDLDLAGDCCDLPKSLRKTKHFSQSIRTSGQVLKQRFYASDYLLKKINGVTDF